MMRAVVLLSLASLVAGQAVTWVPCPGSTPFTVSNSGPPYGPFQGVSSFSPTVAPYSSCSGTGLHFASTCTTAGCICYSFDEAAPCMLQSFVPSNCLATCGELFTPVTALPTSCELGYGGQTGSVATCQKCPVALGPNMTWAGSGSCYQYSTQGPPPTTYDFTGKPTDGVYYLGFGAVFSGPYSPDNVTATNVAAMKTALSAALSVNAANMVAFPVANSTQFRVLMGLSIPSGRRHLLQEFDAHSSRRQLLQAGRPLVFFYINVTTTGSTAAQALLDAFITLTNGPPPTSLTTAMASGFPNAQLLGFYLPGVMSLKVTGGSLIGAPPLLGGVSPSPGGTSPSPSPSGTSPSPTPTVPTPPPVDIPTAGGVPADFVQPYTTPAAQAAALTSIDLSTLSTAAAAETLLQAAYSLNDPSSPLNANATAATEMRDNLLDKLTGAVNISSAGAAELASLATSVSSLVGNPDQISAAGAASALSLLSAISSSGSSGVALSSTAGSAVALGLSSIVSAATSSSNAAVPASALTTVFNVVNSLSTSLVVGVAAGAAPVEILSAAIQMRVQVDVPSADSRLFSAPLTALGSASAFEPLPANIFAGADTSAGVRTQFLSLTFDPYFDPNTSGVTRLAFSTTGGDEVPVNGLSAPIKFTLKAPTGLADGVKAVCQYYDTAAKAYSTVGCVGIPQPQPPGHVLAWVEGYTVATDAEMAKAWGIDGPLMENCAVQILDCSAADPPTIMPNPAKPFAFPGVSCDKNISTAPMLVLAGSQCKMIDPGNNVSCSWSNIKQSFTGSGCVATGGPVDCACRHLTDFAGASKPSIPTASLSDMLSLDPADIVSKLRLLFIVVIVLFGVMNIGALVGHGIDGRERKRFVQALQRPEVGFRVVGDAWLWRFSLDPLKADVGAPTGPAVDITAMLGLPFARLRAALPDELLPRWDLGTALGRARVLSKEALESNLPLQRELAPRLFGSRKPAAGDAALDAAAAEAAATAEAADVAAGDDEKLELFVGTALIIAFLQVAQLLPVVEIAKLKGAAKRYFGDFVTPAGWDFDKTATDFVTLTSPGVLNGTHRWLTRARLWRLILSQSTEGYWEASTTSAFAVEARALEEIADVKPTLMKRMSLMCGALAAEAAELADGDSGAVGFDSHNEESALDDALTAGQQAKRTGKGESEDMKPVGVAAGAKPELSRSSSLLMQSRATIQDCPLTSSAEALTSSMPVRLAAVAEADPDAQVHRVWATMCCTVALQRMNMSYIHGDGYLYEATEKTIVDAGFEWLHAHAAKHPKLQEALADGKLLNRAKNVTDLWHRASDVRVDQLRRSDGIRDFMSLSHLHRAITNIARALFTKHSTFAVFLSEPLDGMQRWQMWTIVVSLVLEQLLVNIWMFYAKSVNCCAEVVELLNGGPDGGSCLTADDCRGFKGTCADLVQQFSNLAVLPDYPAGLADYTCHAFPDEDKPVDSFIVGLISIAIAIPVSMFIAACFAIANDADAPESWLEWVGWRKLVFGANAHRRWHYSGPKGQPNRHVKWYIRSSAAAAPETLINLWHSLVCALTGRELPWLKAAREAKEKKEQHAAHGQAPAGDIKPEVKGDAASAGAQGEAAVMEVEVPEDDDSSVSSSVREARALSRYKRVLATTGFVAVYIVWAVFTWFIFVYGMLIYKLLGDQAQQQFARSWGISYGLNAASEWKDIVIEALKGALILAILERLCLTRNQNWLEEHVDYLSLQALMFKEANIGFIAQIKTIFRHTKRLAES